MSLVDACLSDLNCILMPYKTYCFSPIALDPGSFFVVDFSGGLLSIGVFLPHTSRRMPIQWTSVIAINLRNKSCLKTIHSWVKYHFSALYLQLILKNHGSVNWNWIYSKNLEGKSNRIKYPQMELKRNSNKGKHLYILVCNIITWKCSSLPTLQQFNCYSLWW